MTDTRALSFGLSEGWEAVRKQGWLAPLYWERVPRIALAGASSPFEVGIRFQRCLIRPYAT